MNANVDMPWQCGRAQYQYMNEFNIGRKLGFREAGLSCYQILAHTGHAPKTLILLWNQCIEKGLHRDEQVLCHVM